MHTRMTTVQTIYVISFGIIGSFEGKTYMQLFQYLISKRSVSPPLHTSSQS